MQFQLLARRARARGQKKLISHEDLGSLSLAQLEEHPLVIVGIVKAMLTGPQRQGGFS